MDEQPVTEVADVGGLFKAIVANIPSSVSEFAWNLLSALAVFFVGVFVARTATRLLRNTMTRARFDATLTSFFSNLVYYGLLALVTLAALGNLGVETTQFIAVLGAAGLAIGLALEGALSNFAAGVLIIVFRPFKVGDYIEAAGAAGYVLEIEMVQTVLRTLENERIIIPNSEITGGSIKNFSTEQYVGLEIEFTVPHTADLDVVIRILSEAGRGCAHVLREPSPQVSVMELTRDGVLMQLEVPIKGGDHEDAQYAIVEQVKRDLDAEGIGLARRQLDIHMLQPDDDPLR